MTEQIRRVLRLLYKAEVTHKQNKCSFFAENINHSGPFYLAGHLEHTEHTTDVVWRHGPRTKQPEISRFV